MKLTLSISSMRVVHLIEKGGSAISTVPNDHDISRFVHLVMLLHQIQISTDSGTTGSIMYV
jgi:hypothetical protein